MNSSDFDEDSNNIEIHSSYVKNINVKAMNSQISSKTMKSASNQYSGGGLKTSKSNNSENNHLMELI